MKSSLTSVLNVYKKYTSHIKDSSNVVYHGTKTEEDRENILKNGFNTDSVFFNDKRYDAEGYGQYVIKVDISNLNIHRLSSEDLSKPDWYDRNKYRQYDGICYNFGGGRGTNYEIFNVAKLNAGKQSFTKDSIKEGE